MSSIGNDIIALKTIDVPRTASPRFYTKILSPAEQRLYHKSCPVLPFHYFVWLAWSVKESAYKCRQRLQPDLAFAPVKIEVVEMDMPLKPANNLLAMMEGTGFDLQGSIKIKVQYDNQILYARSVIYGEELIHTVVSPADDFEKVAWGIKTINKTDPASQSAAVRSFLLDRLKVFYPDQELRVQKHASGYPYIAAGTKKVEAPVSVSHHHDYVGYAVSLPKSSPLF